MWEPFHTKFWRRKIPFSDLFERKISIICQSRKPNDKMEKKHWRCIISDESDWGVLLKLIKTLSCQTQSWKEGIFWRKSFEQLCSVQISIKLGFLSTWIAKIYQKVDSISKIVNYLPNFSLDVLILRKYQVFFVLTRFQIYLPKFENEI